MSPLRILRSLLVRTKLALSVFISPQRGGYTRPAWLTGRETFDLSSDTLAGVFRNLYEFEITGTEREWKQVLFYNEMIEKAHKVPGDVAEFGVAGGVSLMAFTRLLNIYDRGLDHKERKNIYGFDSFDGLPDLHDHDVSDAVANEEMKRGGFKDTVGYTHLLNFANHFEHVHLVKGWFSDSLPVFVEDNPSVMFSLVHIDCDLYESTKDVLENVWARVAPGGIVVFDELFHKDFPGETRAFNEFFDDKKGQFSLEKSAIKPDKKYIVKH